MKLVNEKLIKKWEALRLEAYKPTPNDVWTIGWGHTSTAKQGMKITRAEAEKLFDQDVAWAVDAVNQLVKVGLTQHQFDALVSFTFNVGAGAFKGSTLLRKLNVGDYEGAANEFPRWNKQGKKVLRGLVRRRAEEQEYFLTDTIVETAEQSVKPSEAPTLKPLFTSKEIIAGVSAGLTGTGTLLAGLDGESQVILATALAFLISLFGVFIVWNRINARSKGER